MHQPGDPTDQGIERLNAIFQGPLGLPDARIERKLFDYDARARGLDNYISVADCIQLYRLRDELTAAETAPGSNRCCWRTPTRGCGCGVLSGIRSTTITSTGSIPGVLHDWGYTRDTDLFLLTQDVKDEGKVYDVLSRLGPKLLRPA